MQNAVRMCRAAVRSLMSGGHSKRSSCGMVIKSVRSKRNFILLDILPQNFLKPSSCSGVVSLRRDGLVVFLRRDGLVVSLRRDGLVVSLRRDGLFVSLRRDGLKSLVWHAWMWKGLTNSVEQNFVISQWLLVESRNSLHFMGSGGSLPCSKKPDTYFCFEPN
jgi:hypothetical protein